MSELGKMYRYVDYWDERGYERKPAVKCEEYTITGRTEKGCWIRAHHLDKDKFVLDRARKKFAYPTKEEALNSFIRRKNAQIRIVSEQLERAEGASVIAQQMANGGKKKIKFKPRYLNKMRRPVQVPVPPPVMPTADTPFVAIEDRVMGIDPATEAQRHRDYQMAAYANAITGMDNVHMTESEARMRMEQHEARIRQREEAARPVLQESITGLVSPVLRRMRERRNEAFPATPPSV